MNYFPQTIRGQIMAAFIICFLFMGIIIGVNYSNFQRLSSSMEFFELAEDVNNNLLEMRRYEKNYFLYQNNFNFEENISFANRLEMIIKREKGDIVTVIGEDSYSHFENDLTKYIEMMTELHQRSCGENACEDLKGKIRGIGKNLLTLSDYVVVTERKEIDSLLKSMVPLPLLSLLALVILLGFVIFFIGEKVVRPLARITRESEAVTTGQFREISPYGNDKNEIHHLIAAINHMMSELEKRQEELVQSRKVAFIGTLTAGIAHEINNPINNLSLILESLIEEGDDIDKAEQMKLYQEAMDQADRTCEIVKNLLEFSRARLSHRETFEIEQLIDKTARLIRNELKLKSIKYSKIVETKAPPLYFDRGGLQQVLLNLFLNAIQAMERGGELKVVIRAVDTADHIVIDVIDNGKGIPPEHIDQIFDPFFTTKKEGSGTGLGLSVSFNIIQKNGGKMEVRSDPGKETCFTLTLPVTPPPQIRD